MADRPNLPSTTTSTPSRPAYLGNASPEYFHEAIYGKCNQIALVDALRDLLGLYYQPNETEAQRSRHIALFVKDLSNFSDDAVGWAIEQWRQNEDRRPTPATLRQLCMRRLNQAERRLKAERQAAALPPPDQPRDPRPAETMDRLLTTAGFTRDEKGLYWELRTEDDEKKPKPPHWTEAEMSEKMRRSFEHTLRVARSQNALTSKS